MTKREIVKIGNAAIKGDGVVEITAVTEPALNKYARDKKDKEGKRIPCPFENVTKRTVFKFDLNAKYQPIVKEGGEAEKPARKAWTKPTEWSFLKESANKKGKFYLFGKVVSAKSEWFVDGKKVRKAKLTDYLPAKGADDNKDIWLTLGISHIEK